MGRMSCSEVRRRPGRLKPTGLPSRALDGRSHPGPAPFPRNGRFGLPTVRTSAIGLATRRSRGPGMPDESSPRGRTRALVDPDECKTMCRWSAIERPGTYSHGRWQSGGGFEAAGCRDHRGGPLVDGVDDLGAVDPAQIRRGDPEMHVLDMRVIWRPAGSSRGGGLRAGLAGVLVTRWVRSGGRPRAAGAERLPRARCPAGGRSFRSIRSS